MAEAAAQAGRPAARERRFRPRDLAHVQVNPWLIAITVSLATFMEVMDTSIANVALRHIAGSLAAGQSESTWVLTSYLVSNAIILPISGWLASVMGRKRFYMTCVATFTVSSFLCGIAPSLPMLLFFRVLQGAGGGGLAPSEQSILADTFSPQKRGQAFALYGVAVVVAPAIGPALGGWITDNWSWRWIFFINIPVGILSLVLTYFLVQDSESAKKEHEQVWKNGLKVDYLGFGLLAVGLGCLQVVLDKGQEDDWFGSNFITTMAILSAVGIIGTIIWEFITENPIVDLPLFKDLGFFFTCIVMFAVFFILLATTQLLPQLVQQLFHYDATKAGLILMPGGFFIMMLMPLVGFLVNKVQPKWLIVFGLLVEAASMEYLTHLDLNASFWTIAWARVFQAGGLAFLFVPINTVAYVGLPAGKSNNASALINAMRNLGGSVGISFVTTSLERRSQFHQNRLIGNLAPYHSSYLQAISHATTRFMQHGSDAAGASSRAIASLYQTLQGQATMLSYIDVFRMLAIGSLLAIGLAVFLKRMNPGEKPAGGH
ncbi:MAG TPA: DHA2 family efflux MFS transporter permease subunit [Tepidisphaeraceae bacterium]|nr:DHA2 family efflux MFS transporter permease subunit [Tepidisphaeraceae bacterium]